MAAVPIGLNLSHLAIIPSSMGFDGKFSPSVESETELTKGA
jgi:hypothetical protein